MNKKQKIVLVLSIASFIMVLSSFLLRNMLLLLIFFIVNSVLMILFNFFADEKEEKIDITYEEATEKINSLKEENEKLKDSLSDKERTMALLKEEAENAKTEAGLAKEKAAKARKATMEAIVESESYKENVKKKTQYDITTILPHIYSNEADERTEDLIAIAKLAINDFKEYAVEKGVDIRLSTNMSELPITGNSKRFEIMFKNIIDNAIKYMNRPGSLVITISKLEDKAFLVLKDDGEGLPEDEITHVFDLNFQGSNRRSGNGLGLSQSKAIVEHYNGEITAKSNVNQGMAIYVELPCSKNKK